LLLRVGRLRGFGNKSFSQVLEPIQPLTGTCQSSQFALSALGFDSLGLRRNSLDLLRDLLSQVSEVFAIAYRPEMQKIAARHGLKVSRPRRTDEGGSHLVIHGGTFSEREIAGIEIEQMFESKNKQVRKQTDTKEVRFLL